jgi:hypothetical protein
MRLKTNGYYVSKAIPYEDWQSGHKFQGEKFDYIFFREDGKYFLYYGREEKVDFSVFSEEMGYGTYIETENGIDAIFRPNSKYPAKVSYNFISPDGLESETGERKYFFSEDSIELLASSNITKEE